ncbi:AAA family ATPase [Colwellia sp. 6_MG-2023]|uniref:AAA family ATPase n=1 Tax=Colwellia sp. 6_MG-2023 TaxID=3062676 RepID=UPI0026E31ACD|nr:AAA family ATPase [Colwellia sp. 6_MG-2023]MDO6489269.1 AAA family ATPase [Colwellia sp. 6_MG-2023]
MRLKETLINALNNSQHLAKLVEQKQFGSSNYEDRVIKRRWGVGDAAKLVGISKTAIDKAETNGRLPPPELGENGRRIGYSIYQINEMRELFDTAPYRKEGDDPLVVSVCGHKGGGWKTSVSVHLAQWLALQGYRVLLVDHDPQGTTSLYHGYTPMRVADENTLLPFYLGDEVDLSYSIVNTYWPGLDLIPSNPSVDRIKLELPKLAESGKLDIPHHLILQAGLETVKDNYDFVIVDGTPDLSDITINMVFAADLILCPTPAIYADYISTSQFFSMMLAMIEDIDDNGFEPELKVLITHFDNGTHRQAGMMDNYIRQTWPGMVYKHNIRKTEEVPKAQLKMRTVFEQASAERSNHGAYKNALAIFEPAFTEILNSLILTRWPSKGEL